MKLEISMPSLGLSHKEIPRRIPTQRTGSKTIMLTQKQRHNPGNPSFLKYKLITKNHQRNEVNQQKEKDQDT